MAGQHVALFAFNRGLVSRLGLARQDLKRMALAAEEMTNWMPRVIGSMMIRPGLGYTGATASNNAARQLPFVFSISDKASIELTNVLMRIWIGDTLVSRVSVASAVANGNFDTNLASWTDNDEAGGVSAWVAGGYMGLTGNGTAAAIQDQTVTVAGGDQNKEHALRIVVQRGPVVLRVGTGTTDDSYVNETVLGTGQHSLAFTPSGNFNIRFLSRLKRQVLVDSCNVEAAGTMTIPTPWIAADLGKIRYDQSADVVFLACAGYQQRRIERRATRSWSIVTYEPEDGPFDIENIGPITMTPAALSGNTTLTASAAYFKSTNVGSLFSVTSNGQTVTATATAQNTFTSAIRVTGVDAGRVFSLTLSGLTATGSTVTLQRSLDSASGPWTDVANYTTDQSGTTFDDTLDNQIAWYRIGVKTGNYVAGTIVMTLNYANGSIRGICRVTAFSSSTAVNIEVISDFGATAATDVWAEGEWSDRRGWPSSVGFHEGRLFWAGKNGVWGSISDAYDSFDAEFEGDAGPIARTVGSGPVDTINWLVSLQRLMLGAQGAEFACRSSSFDEPLTPSNFNIKTASNQGSSNVDAVKVDDRAIFVQRGGTRAYELSMSAENYEYGANHLSAIVPDIGKPSISRIAVQRQPDTRVHFVRSDGTVAVLVFDKVENVICWLEIESTAGAGAIEDVMVLPGDEGSNEDIVYYIVRRTINGATVRYRERWAMESECLGDAQLCKLADSFLTYTGAATTTMTGLDHLEGQQVVVWADGADVGTGDDDSLTYTVAGGQVTIGSAAANWVVGLRYTARWRSAKLVQIPAQLGTALGQHKAISGLAFILADVHPKGIKFGPDFDTLVPLPEVEEGAILDPDAMRTDYDQEPIPFPSKWSTDARVCLEAVAPRPVTVLAAVCEVTMNE